MKFHFLNRLTFSVTLLAVGTFCPNLPAADWGSLHGNNRSAPSAPAAHPQSQPSRAPQVNHASPPASRPNPQPAIRTPKSQPAVQPMREQPRVADRVQPRRGTEAHAPAGEINRRRMDIDEDRRQSYFWSDFHAGMRLDRLPDGYRRFRLHDHDFFYFEGVYYDNGPSGYVIVAPPMNANIPDLPPGVETLQVGNTLYYYVAGAFYVQQPDGSYVVVAAPIGVTVALLPPDAASVVVNGVGYFQADGVFYQPVMQNGVTAYLVIPQP
jgi:hypothetical protein